MRGYVCYDYNTSRNLLVFNVIGGLVVRTFGLMPAVVGSSPSSGVRQSSVFVFSFLQAMTSKGKKGKSALSLERHILR